MNSSTKIKGLHKLSKPERENIVLELIEAFVNCKTIEEAAMFTQDLLTESELSFISRRLRIAKLLLQDKTYKEIQDLLYVSQTTIAKIAFWLNHRGEGFRSIIKKLPNKPVENNDPLMQSRWASLKRQYPVYFLPEIIIEQIVKTANKKQKERLSKVISDVDSSMKAKSQLHRELERLLRPRNI
jgi:TrpR-related protein YerC/YecD